MARANHARCLHCGVRLPLYRQLTEAGFCSTQHRKAFQDDQARLAVARLIENQEMLSRASEQSRDLPFECEPESVEQEPVNLEAAEDTPATPSEAPADTDFASFERGETPDVAELADWPSEPPAEKPVTLAAVEEVEPAIEVLAEPEVAVEVEPDPPQPGVFPLKPNRVWMSTPNLVAADPIAFEFCGETILPAVPAPGPADPCFATAPKVPIAVSAADALRRGDAPPAYIVNTATPEVMWPAAPGRAPFVNALRVATGLRHIGRIDAVENIAEPLSMAHAAPPRCATWLPLPGASRPAESIPDFAGLRALSEPLPKSCVASVLAMSGIEPRQLPPVGLPRFASVRSRAALVASNDLAENSVALFTPSAAGSAAGCLPAPCGPASIRVREFRPTAASRIAGTALRHPSTVPIKPAGAVEPPLTWGIKGSDCTCVEPHGNHACPQLPPTVLSSDLQLATKVAIPLGSGAAMQHTRGLMLRAMQSNDLFPAALRYPKAKFELQRLAGDEFLTLAASLRPAAVAKSARNTARYLKAASRGIQLMAIAIPVLLFIAFRPAPKPEPTSAVPGPVGRFVSSRITEVKSALQSRAGLEYLDDFRAGLDNWEGQSDLTRSWSYDQTGFVKPGPLALYRPSLGMSDYQFEFLGQIDRHAIGWVFRAQDLNNYQAAKIVMLKSGPLPTVGLERYSVINGRVGRRVQVVLPLNVHQDTVYRIRMEIRGADYALYVQDQLVHFWSDPRLLAGGVGFFSGHGEQSRIRWMQISHQYDAIGRLCAYFAPMAIATYNLDSSMGAGSK